MKNDKTHVMRVLEQHKIDYASYTYGDGMTASSGTEVAELLGKDPLNVFKTLVTVGKSGKNYVFVVPVPFELDLKKAAEAVGEKNIEMIRSRELLPLTGYVHGGCSPIGMKKQFPTFIHETAASFDKVFVSAGKVGFQIELDPKDLISVAGCILADIVTGR